MGRWGQGSFIGVLIGAAALVVGSSLLGIGVNIASPSGIPLLLSTGDAGTLPSLPLPEGLTSVGLPEVQAVVAEGAGLLVDAREPDEYEIGHIPGAVNLPAYEFDDYFPEVVEKIEAASRLIVYCDGAECSDSVQVAERLLDFGFSDISVFEGGYRAWTEAGEPTEEGRP